MDILMKKLVDKNEDVVWSIYKHGKALNPFLLIRDFQLKQLISNSEFEALDTIGHLKKIFKRICEWYGQVGPTKRGAGDLTITFKFPESKGADPKIIVKYDAYDLTFDEEFGEGIEIIEGKKTITELFELIYFEVAQEVEREINGS